MELHWLLECSGAMLDIAFHHRFHISNNDIADHTVEEF